MTFRMQTMSPRDADAILALFLGDELDAAALPLPPRLPSFTAETVRPPRRS